MTNIPKSFMFDTSAFNHIVDYGIDVAIFPTTNHYYVTHLQLDELKKTKDIPRRERLLGVFSKVITLKVLTESALWNISKWDEAKWSDEPLTPTESFVLNVSRLNAAKISDGTILSSLIRDMDTVTREKKNYNETNNKIDMLMGETCIKNGFIFVTDDNAAMSVIKKYGGQAITLKQFCSDKEIPQPYFPYSIQS